MKKEELLVYLVAASPALFILTALVAKFGKGVTPLVIKRMATNVSLFSILLLPIAWWVVYSHELVETQTLGWGSLGFSLRLDTLNLLVFAMIVLIVFPVLRFSSNYLEGDPSHVKFIGQLCATIASVQLLVLSGNLGLLFISWLFTSFNLQRLLVFYPERWKAKSAGKKKFLVARIGDVCFLIATVLLFNEFKTGNLDIIFHQMTDAISSKLTIEFAAVLLTISALLKSAQFPSHGWLIEVVETPTPVSALLHAGLLNAGPYLIIRLSPIIGHASVTPILLIVVGGVTSLFGSLVFLTQSSVKTSLGYSSIAHMGFSLMICGLGGYPAAMLHLVSHSFYKAHAFLSSGSFVDIVIASNVPVPKRLGKPWWIFASIVSVAGLYLLLAQLFHANPTEKLSVFVAGGIIVMSVSQLMAAQIDSTGSPKAFLQISLLSLLVIAAFFILEQTFANFLDVQVASNLNPGLGSVILISVLLAMFFFTILIQLMAPALPASNLSRQLGVHFRNGWYVNAYFDRLVGALKLPSKN